MVYLTQKLKMIIYLNKGTGTKNPNVCHFSFNSLDLSITNILFTFTLQPVLCGHFPFLFNLYSIHSRNALGTLMNNFGWVLPYFNICCKDRLKIDDFGHFSLIPSHIEICILRVRTVSKKTIKIAHL